MKRQGLHCILPHGVATLILWSLFSKKRTECTNSLLCLALWNGQVGVVELLLAKGASIKPIKEKRMNPFHLAVWSGHPGVVEIILKKK